jgi:RHS repeat-associated protein
MQARYYSSSRGDFLSEDPVAAAIGDGNAVAQIAGQSQQAFLSDPQQLNSYAYARNNPVINRDPTGKAFGLDDAAGFALGGFVGSGIYLGESYFTGQPITAGGFGGSFVSGGILGWGAINTPETGGLSDAAAFALRYGLTAGAVGNTVKQRVNIATGAQRSGFSVADLAGDTAFTGLTTFVAGAVVPDAGIPGLSSGRGNMKAIGQAMETKLANGTIGSVSAATAFKSAIGSQGGDLYRTLTSIVADLTRVTFGLQSLLPQRKPSQ